MIALDLLLTRAHIVDVFRLRTFEGWVGIRDGRIIYAEEGEPPAETVAAQTRNLEGRFLAPGLLDAHMHIESSLVTPRGFAEAVLPWGTTTILADPHEVANVAGIEGVQWMIRASAGLPLRIYYAIPSCVPATSPDLEWTAAVFDAAAVRQLAVEPSVIALGEVMDYRSILSGSERLGDMVRAAHDEGFLVEGHAPNMQGTDLSEYLAWRITSDHTLTSPDRIREQISKGVAVMIQAITCTPENIAAAMALPDRSLVLLITDDVEPSRLAKGHLSSIVQTAFEAGMPAIEAWASATIRPARYLGLRDLGAVAPGFRADLLILDDLNAFPPREVLVNGQTISSAGELHLGNWPARVPPPSQSLIPDPLSPQDFRLVPDSNSWPDTIAANAVANAVVLLSEEIYITGLERILIAVDAGYAQLAPETPLALVAVIARNRSSRTVGIVKDLGLREGAFATSFAHDSHNLLVVGRDVDDMCAAANTVLQMGGGVAVVRDGAVLAKLALPVLGLLSEAPLPAIIRDFKRVEDWLRALGVRHRQPFLMLSLLSLSVSPHYKFTDKGVLDTERRRLLPPWEETGRNR